MLQSGWQHALWIESFFETDDSGVEIDSIYQAASLLLQLPVARLAKQVIANWNAISKRKIS